MIREREEPKHTKWKNCKVCVGELTQEEIENLNSFVAIEKLEYFPSLSANTKKQNKTQTKKTNPH